MGAPDAIAAALMDGDADAVDRLVAGALEAGRAPAEILEEGLIAGMALVGRRFRESEIFVPEVLVAARAMKAGLARLEPRLGGDAEGGSAGAGTVLLGTVRGDIHDIGKNLVGIMLRGAGFRVVDVGVDVAPGAFVSAVREHRPDVVGLSALLTTTMARMGETVDAIRTAGLAVPIMVGGAPVTPEFASEIGADGYGESAADAAERARELMDAPGGDGGGEAGIR